MVIEREDAGDVAVLRPAHGPVNAMDVELVEEITEVFRRLADDPARAVVLTGSGRSFSAGVDLRRYLADGASYVTAYLPRLSEAFRAVFDLPKPVVAAVNGHAVAGGCVLACCADLRLMADGPGGIGVPELRVGVPFPRSALEILRYAVGAPAAARLVLGAAILRPAEAAAIGLVAEVVEPARLLEQAVAAAADLAENIPADTFAVTKRQLHRETDERIDAYAADEDPAVEALWTTRATDGWTARYLESVTRRG